VIDWDSCIQHNTMYFEFLVFRINSFCDSDNCKSFDRENRMQRRTASIVIRPILQLNRTPVFRTYARENDPMEKNREEEWSRKRDMEIVKKLAEKMQHTPSSHEQPTEVKKDLSKAKLEQKAKEKAQKIEELKKKIDDLQFKLQESKNK
jgi:hypothetical protein